MARDLTSPRTIILKGWLFFLLGLMGTGLLWMERPTLRTAFLLAITIWSFCRFYYFLFHVLEHYVRGRGHPGPFAGIGDLLTTAKRKPLERADSNAAEADPHRESTSENSASRE